MLLLCGLLFASITVASCNKKEEKKPEKKVEEKKSSRSEERRVEKECRSRWSPYH